MNITSQNFTDLCSALERQFLLRSRIVHPAHWQGLDVSKKPDAATHELLDVTVRVLLGVGSDSLELGYWRNDIRPHLPWADDHFAERVSGEPLNPGETWKTWRHADSAAKFKEQGQFNHTYAERFWPKWAGRTPGGRFWGPDIQEEVPINNGIRHAYGDLNDVVALLVKDPLTRQAYLPIFFPEDTGIGDGGRKPCTLGYQFILRDNKLHIYYPMRSCDFANHFRDDCYLAVRLLLWMIEQCQIVEEQSFLDEEFRGRGAWDNVVPGTLTMHCTSLHLFRNDFIALEKRYA